MPIVPSRVSGKTSYPRSPRPSLGSRLFWFTVGYIVAKTGVLTIRDLTALLPND